MGSEFLSQDIVVGKALREHAAAHVFALQINLCDEVVLCLFRNTETGLAPLELYLAGTCDDLNSRGKEGRFRQLVARPKGLRTFDHHHFHAALWRTSQHKFIHETANKKNSSPALF